MARNVVDELVVRLTADASRLQAELGKAETGAQSSGKKIGASFAQAFQAAARLGAAAAISVTAVGTALVTAANKAAVYADNIDKAALRTRLSRKSVQELQFAADQLGGSFGDIETAVQGLTMRLAGAEQGSERQTEAFKRLGVSTRDASGNLRNTEDLFFDLVGSLQGVSNETERAVLAQEVFGRSAASLGPILSSGAGSLEEVRKKANELGLVLGDQSISALVAYKDAASAVSQQFGALGRELVLTFLPVLTDKLIPFITDSAIPALQDLIKVLGGESSSLRFAATSTARALGNGDANSLAGSLDGIIDKLGDTGLIKALRDAQTELRLTGTVGVTAAQDIERALAVIRAQADLTQNLLRFNPAEAALRQAGASVLGDRAVPNADVDVRQLIQAGNIEGAYNVALSALEALTTPVRGSLAGPVPFQSGAIDALRELVDSLRVSVQSIAAAAFVPAPTPTPTPPPGNGDGTPDGSADDPFFVNPYGTPFGNQRDALTGSASFRRGAASATNPDTAFVQSILDADRDLNTFQTTLENLARAGREVTRDISNPGVSVAVGAPINVRPEVSAVVDYGRTVARSGQELERLFAGSRILQSVETRQRVEDLAAASAAEATAALNDFTVSLDELARRGRAQAQANAVVAAREADPFAGVPGVNPGRQFQMDQRAGGAAVPIVFDVGAVARATNERVVEELDLEAEALAFKKNVVSAGVQFASDLASAIKSGSPSGIFGALTGGIGNLVGISNPFAGGLISIIGGLFGGFLPDGRDSSDAARAAGARPNGAPAIELNLSVFQNLAVNSLTGGDRAAVDGLLDQTVSRIESVLVSFGQRLTAVEARTA